jgi:hypothetical protein
MIRRYGFLLIVVCQTVAACGEDSVPANVMSWFKMNHESIQITATGDDRTSYVVDIAPNQDMRARVQSNSKGKTSSNELMLISGTLLVKGGALSEGYEIDAIDEVSLSLQLVNQLLAAGTQKSPDDIKKPVAIDRTEGKRTLCVATMSASGEYEAPWHVAGWAEPKTAGAIAFNFKFSAANLGVSAATYTGEWRHDSKPVAFGDDMPTSGWKVYRIGPIQKREGNSTILDYGASPDTHTYATLGELRKAQASPKSIGKLAKHRIDTAVPPRLVQLEFAFCGRLVRLRIFDQRFEENDFVRAGRIEFVAASESVAGDFQCFDGQVAHGAVTERKFQRVFRHTIA